MVRVLAEELYDILPCLVIDHLWNNKELLRNESYDQTCLIIWEYIFEIALVFIILAYCWSV